MDTSVTQADHLPVGRDVILCRAGAVRTPGRMAVSLLAFATLLCAPLTARSERLPPVIEALTAPLSDSEVAGIGCLVGTALAGGAVVALAGGPRAAALAVQGPLAPAQVLEGGAAMAFLVSSACYVGQALAPVVMLGWSSITDMLTPAPAVPAPSVPGPVASAALAAKH